MRRLASILVVTVLAISSGCSRRLPDFERMRQQPRVDPYDASGVFSDGMAMRVPPHGTVPRAAAHIARAVATGLDRDAPVRDVPLPVTTDLLTLGRHQFDIFCAVCHGSDASGRSIMSGNMPGVPPPSLLTIRVAEQPAGSLFEVISHGRNRMPAYDWALPAADRWAVIAYLQSLQRSATSHPAGAAR